VQITGEDDDETLLNLLRRAHHAELFRTLARDVEGVLTVEQVADELSALADATLKVTARWCWDRLKQRHRDTPRFAILGYGKLGGKELGYGSDLDIVFVYEDETSARPMRTPRSCARSSTGCPPRRPKATCSRSTRRCGRTGTPGC
jgi:glutamate-ammonia-ligase adenylyltransferase